MPRRLRLAAIAPHLVVMALAAITAFTILHAPSAKAELVTTIYNDGCYVCQGQLAFFRKTSCVYPKQDGWGSDICTEVQDQIVLYAGPQDCSLTGNACMFYSTTGGGTGGGGGGGDSCGGGATYCPPQCFDCGGSYY